MARDNGQGIFKMQAINDIAMLKNIDDAKAAAYKLAEEATASAENKAKANQLISRARSIKELLLGMSNFSLAHMGMKTFR